MAKKYPTCSIRKAALELNIDRTTVTRYWNKELDKRVYRDFKQDVINWQYNNISGSKLACSRELGICKETVAKYWDDELFEKAN